MTEFTPFIPSFATQQLLPPWEAEATVYGFGFRIPESAIRDYVDRYFNSTEPRERRFQFDPAPNCEFGILFYSNVRNARTNNIASNNHSRRSFGTLNYKEAFVCVPISRRNISIYNVLSEPIYEWCQPIAVCDCTTVIFSAREIVGLDVLPGRITETYRDDGGFTLTVQLYGVETFSPTSKEELIPLLEVDVPPGSSQEGLPDERSEDVIRAIRNLNEKTRSPTIGPWLPQHMQVVTLKQFRDASKMDIAIYQALVTSQISRHALPDASTVPILLNERKVTLQLSENATTREMVQTFLGQPPPEGRETTTADGKEVWQNVERAQHPTLAFRLDCKVEVDQVKTDVTLS
jgi:hypothetical protein